LAKTSEHALYINNARNRIQRDYPDTCNFFNLTTKDNVVLDAVTLRHPDHKHATMADTKWIVSFPALLFLSGLIKIVKVPFLKSKSAFVYSRF
jgi:hypothetical protein